MKNKIAICITLIFSAVLANADTLITGTPGDAYLSTPTKASPSIGTSINFDSLTANTVFNPSTYAGLGLTISSPDGLLVLPYSSQSFPNELFDNSSDGSANITLSLSKSTNEFGIGIADSDPVTVTLQALNSSGMVFGSIFSVNVNTSSPTNNPGNAYFVVADTTSDIYGLKILQTSGSVNNSGLAIDDVQFTPEPGSLVLILIGFCALACLKFRKSLSA